MSNENKFKYKYLLILLAIALFILPLVSALSLSKDAQIQNNCLGYNFTIIANSTVDSFVINSTCAGDVNNLTIFYNPTFLAINNSRASGNVIFQVVGTNMLATNGTSLCNGSSSNLALNTGQVNVTLLPNGFCYMFDNLNLTEGITRDYSPITFSSVSNTKKKVTSTSIDILTVPVIFNVAQCDTVGKITYTSNSGIVTGYFPGDYTCSDNQVQLTLAIESGSNEIDIEYGCGVMQRVGYRLVMIMFSLMIIVFCIVYIYYKGGIFEINLNDILIMFIVIVVGITAWLAAGQNLGGSCGVIS